MLAYFCKPKNNFFSSLRAKLLNPSFVGGRLGVWRAGKTPLVSKLPPKDVALRVTLGDDGRIFKQKMNFFFVEGLVPLPFFGGAAAGDMASRLDVSGQQFYSQTRSSTSHSRRSWSH